MTTRPHLEAGLGLAIDTGGTNVRSALVGPDNTLYSLDSGQAGYDMQDVAPSADAYFDWLAGQVRRAQDSGAEWLVLGVPCMVRQAPQGGQYITNALNPGTFYASGVNPQPWHVQSELLGRGIEGDFPVIAANDLGLFAAAAASRYARQQDQTVLGISLGTGMGMEIMQRTAGGWQDSGYPMEAAALLKIIILPGNETGTDKRTTYEHILCQGGLARMFGLDPSREPIDQPDHPYWRDYGYNLRVFVYNMRALFGGDIVVIGGGRAAALRPYFEPHYINWPLPASGSKHYNNFETIFVSSAEADSFALYGAQIIRHANVKPPAQ